MPEVIINGPEGRLEGRYTHGEAQNAPIALFLHPHPVHGGTMNNKVVYELYHTFARRGFSCLRPAAGSRASPSAPGLRCSS